MTDSGVMRLATVVWLLVQRRSILGLLVHGSALVFLRQKFLDFPVVLLDTNGEF